MDKDIQELRNLVYKPILKESKFDRFLDDDTFKRNYGKLMILSGTIRNLDKKFSDFEKMQKELSQTKNNLEQYKLKSKNEKK